MARERFRRGWMGIAVLLVAARAGLADERKFLSGYAGTIPPRASDRARTYFDQPPVRSLIARLEKGSLPAAAVDAALDGSGASKDDLLRVGLLRRDGERLAIGFAYFTAADMKTIHAIADRAAREMVPLYRRHGHELDRIVASYSAAGVPRGELAFVLVAGFGLNWDGLALTREMGLRRPRLVEGDGFQYSFWASEEVPGRDYREFYWGSSTAPLADPGDARAWSFSSFGDPDSDPRMNFPDLAYLSAGDMTPAVRAAAGRIGLRETEEFGQKFHGVLGGAVMRHAADVLFALRKSPLSEAELRTAAGGDPAPLVALLEEIGYVEGADGGWRLRVPVLDAADRPILDDALALNRRVLRSWLQFRGAWLRRELSGLTAIRAGLPFEALFTQVWHEIFGATTRELARAGIIASAYAKGAHAPGSFSVLWRQSLYKFIPG